jgi:hypothetical protein
LIREITREQVEEPLKGQAAENTEGQSNAGGSERKKGPKQKLPSAHERYVLKPENKDKAYPLLRPDSLEILGVVTGSFRSYRR